jgi:hypothetical protein
MAENVNALILPIGADVTQFEKSINEVEKAYKSLQKEIAGKPFNLITDKDRQDLEGYKRTLDSLQSSVNKVDFKNLTFGSKESGRALSSLSLVAQDAPFGFIGIQNNLPNLITSFANLDTKTNGLKGAFKDLGSALVGPAGAFLAFSAITAGITVLVQKYGSLGNAISAIIGGNEKLSLDIAKLNKEYAEYSKNIDNVELSLRKSEAAESGKLQSIKILTETVTDLSESESVRSNALNQLKEFDKDYYDQFTISTLNADTLREATDKLTDSIIAQAQARGLESRISKITEQIEELTFAQEQLAPEFSKTSKKLSNSLGEVQRAAFQSGGVGVPFLSDLFQLNQVTNQLSEGDKNIELERSRLEKTKEKLQQTLSEIVSIPKKTTGNKGGKNEFTLGLNTQDLDAAFNLDKIISSITKYGNALIDTNNSVKERKNALKELIAINPQVFSGLSLEKSATIANIDAIEQYLRSLEVLKKEKEFSARASQLNSEFLKAEIKSQDAAVKAEEDAFESLVKLTYGQDQYGNSTDKSTRLNNKFVESLGELQDIDQGVIDILTKGLGVENTYEKAIKDLLNFEAFQKSAVDRISRNFRFLQNPLEDLFGSVLEDGIANWQAFGDAVVSEIKKIAAAILAKQIITLLGNLLAPGLGSVLGKGFSAISDQTLFDFANSGGSANFSGVQGGGMQMAGAVNLTLRGSDLVGSINRTNSTINRVG